MATVQNPASPAKHRGVPALRPGKGHTYFLRKLHSLTGIIPIGAFLVEHLISNWEATKGPIAYARQVQFLNSLPFVHILEWVFIFLPIAYHALYGLNIWRRGKSNVIYYPWAGNWMYLLQRITGIIALAYIIQHVWEERFSGVVLHNDPGAAFHKMQMTLSNPWMVAVYVIGLLAVCWHFSYGIWLFCAKWGITPGAKARKRLGYAVIALGIILAAIGLSSIYAFVGPHYRNAPANLTPQQISTGVMNPGLNAGASTGTAAQ